MRHKVQQQLCSLCRLLNTGPVATAVQPGGLAALDVCLVVPGVLGIDQLVVAAPEDQDLHRQLRQVSPQVVAPTPHKSHDGLPPTCRMQKLGVRRLTPQGTDPSYLRKAQSAGDSCHIEQKHEQAHCNLHNAEVRG